MASTAPSVETGRAGSKVPEGITATTGLVLCVAGAFGAVAAQPANRPIVTMIHGHTLVIRSCFFPCIASHYFKNGEEVAIEIAAQQRQGHGEICLRTASAPCHNLRAVRVQGEL